MEWVFPLLYLGIQLEAGYGSAVCPIKFKTYSWGLESPTNFTGECPVISVTSESDCLEEFCNIYYSKTYKNCHGKNAFQYNKIDNESTCYIMQLNHCTEANGCLEWSHAGYSKIYIVSDDTPSYNYSGETEPGDCSPSQHFRCIGDGACIPISLQCDGDIACQDGSDEMGCKQYLSARTTDKTMVITAVAVGAVLSLLLIVLMFACGQRLYVSHYERRTRLRNLRLGSSGADYVVRLLPGEAPFQDTLPPSYTDSVLIPNEEPPIYEPTDVRDRLIDLAESSGYISPPVEESSKLDDTSKLETSSLLSEPGPSSFEGVKLDDLL